MLTIALCAAMLACPAALAEGVTAETGQVKAAIVTEAAEPWRACAAARVAVCAGIHGQR